MDEPDLAPLLPALRAAAARERPFAVTLGRLGLFKRRARSTLWLALDAEGGADRVARMMGRFDAAVGNPRPGPPVPHLTLAHFDEAAEAEAALAALRGGFEADPIRFEATGLCVMYRDGKRGRFRPLEGPTGWLGFGEQEEPPMAFGDMPPDAFLAEAGVPPPWSRDAPGRGPRRRKRRPRRPQGEEEGAGARGESPG